MPSWKKIILSGSDAALNSLNVSSSITASSFSASNGFTGSLLGTSSWATNAISASFINRLNQSVIITGSTTITGSLNLTGSLNILSGSITLNSGSLIGTASRAITASHALNGGVTKISAGSGITISPTNGIGDVTITNASAGGATFPFTGSAIISGSLIITGSTNSSGGFTGSLFGTASFVVTASVAQQLSATDIATNGNYKLLFKSGATTIETAHTDAGMVYNPSTNRLFVDGPISSSNDNFAVSFQATGGVFGQSGIFTGYVQTTNVITTNITASIISASSSITGSLFGTASWATNATNATNADNIDVTATTTTSEIIPVFTSAAGTNVALLADTSGISYIPSNNILKLSGSIIQTGSLNIFSGSITLNSGSLIGTASFATTASHALNGGVTSISAGTGISINQSTGNVTITNASAGGATFPFTGSAIISGSLIITGSTNSSGGFTGSLQGTSSFALISSFALNTPPGPNPPLLYIYSASTSGEPQPSAGNVIQYDSVPDSIRISTQSHNGVSIAPTGFAQFYYTEVGSLITLRATGSGAFKTYQVVGYNPVSSYVQYTIQLANIISSGTINNGDVVEFRWDKSAGVGTLQEANFVSIGDYNDSINIFFNNGGAIIPGLAEINTLSYTGSGYIAAAITKSANLTLNSLNVTNGVTGSLFGTASFATTASYALNGGVTSISAGSGISINQSTGNVTITNIGGGGATFPYTGSAIISGSLIVTGSTEITQNLSASALKIGNLDRPLSLTGGLSFAGTSPKIKALGDNNQIEIDSTLIISASAKLAFKDLDNTYITSNNDSPEDLEIHADQDILLLSDNNVGIKTTTPTSASLHVSGNIFADSITGSLFGTASYTITASLAIRNILTASVSLNTITFTKGDGSTFNITVNTGSGGGGGVTINNNVDNYLITATGTANTLNGESGLTWTGTSLRVEGSARAYNIDIESKPSPTIGLFDIGSQIARSWVINTGSNPSINAGEIVYFSTGSHWVTAQANSTGSSTGLLGVVTRDTTPQEILLQGAITLRNSLSTYRIGQPVYLSPISGGSVTNIPPTASGHVARYVGYVINTGSNAIYFNPDFTWIQL